MTTRTTTMPTAAERGGDGTPIATELVSVVTPCRDAAPWVAETIRSVLAQRHPAVEHIVVDDASRDGSWEAIAAFGDRVRAVRLDRNVGGGAARNHGASLARGTYVMFLDADDVLAPDALASLVAALRAGGGDLAACRWSRLRADRRGRWSAVSPHVPQPRAGGANLLRAWLEGAWIPPCALLWRRASYDRTGGWDERLAANQDGDLVLRALLLGQRLVVAEGGHAFYRAHDGPSVGTDHADVRKLASRLAVLEKVEGLLAASGGLDESRRSLGVAYQRLALFAFPTDRAFARRCLEHGERLAGRRAVVSRTRAGRLACRVLGLERKERLAAWFAARGLATRVRRRASRTPSPLPE
ncbi:MAG TPA: glycosyltransferase [Gemmatimonadaceae bacterium]|nr:glycosyltransferase [Gemmatimonadaceae bacterium]